MAPKMHDAQIDSDVDLVRSLLEAHRRFDGPAKPCRRPNEGWDASGGLERCWNRRQMRILLRTVIRGLAGIPRHPGERTSEVAHSCRSVTL